MSNVFSKLTGSKFGKKNDAKKAKLGPNMNFAAKEAFNLLRTNLLYTLPIQEGGKVVGITSSAPQEGKSTTAINLAYSISETGRKVLLIDADMRCPTVAKNIDLPASPGLSNLIIQSDVNVIHKNILREGLDVIVAGDIPPNPADLLGSERMRQLISLFSDHYDFIIVDLPPVKAVSDPLVISKLLSGVVLIVRHEYSRRRDVIDTVRRLKFVGVHVLGFVYNYYDQMFTNGKKNYKGYYQYHGNSAESDGRAPISSSNKAVAPKEAREKVNKK